MTVTAACLPLLLALAAATTQPPPPLQLPDVKFSCQGRETGYYADVELRCSVFHYCGAQGDRYSFVCPPKSTFNQRLLMCDYEAGALEMCPHSESLYNISKTTPRLRKPVTRPPRTTTTPPPSRTPSTTTAAVFGKPRSTTTAPPTDEEEEWLDDEGNETQWLSNETHWSQPIQHQEDGGWQPSEPLFDRDALFHNLRSHESAVTYEEPRGDGSGANSFVVYDPNELGRPFYYQPEPANYEPPRPPWQPMAQVLLGRPAGNYYKTPSGYFEFRHRSSSSRRARSTRVKRQLLLSRLFKRQPLRLPPPREEESGWLPSIHFPLRGFFPPDPSSWPSLQLPPAKSPAPFQAEPRPHGHAFSRPMPRPDHFLQPRAPSPPFSPELRPWSQLGVSYLSDTMFVPPHVIPGRSTPPHVIPGRSTPPHVIPGRSTPPHVIPGWSTPPHVIPGRSTPPIVPRQTASPVMVAAPRQKAASPLLPPRQTAPPPMVPIRQAAARLPVKRPPPRKKNSRRRRPTPRTTTRSPPVKDNRTFSWFGGWTTSAPPMSVPAKPTLASPTLPRPTQMWSLPNKSSNSSSKSTTTATLKLSATTPFSWERLRPTTSTSTPRPATVVRVFSNKIGSSVMATAGTPRTTTSTTPSTTAADVKENVIGNGRDRGFPFEFFTDVNKLVARTTPQPQPVYKPPASREPVTEVVTAISFSESALAA
ncbi:uncharacterized protein LOC119404345 [Rhipicephalus sanguineus]|uniref:Chitin-binding type-2 domain-containing protein n=1 Tax=Rhipicephalus sanguineus TaxID=34632 RepID=A0A9D4SP12_RHISA|nr:uncharacterized protein LOC119404345 [Rhipicephalus sanguineus]KAH7936437.1 hypothetical protein HPB52_023422 [Rhipicephalus sanguineus]